MAFSLAPFVGEGTTENPYRPDVAGAYAVIDLRADSTQQAGWCLLSAGVVPSGAVDLGELDVNMPRGVSRNLENALEVTLDQTSNLRAIIVELLTFHGSFTDPSRWNPLIANRFGRHRIVMAGEVIYDAPVPQGATISDDFNRADGAIGSNWSGDTATSAWEIESNTLAVRQNASARIYYSAASLDGTDAEAEVDVTDDDDVAGESRGLSPTVRTATDGTDTYYELVNRRASSELWLREVTAGAETTIASKTLLPSVPFNLRVRADGSTITGYVDDVEELSTTDTQITTGLTAGIRQFGADESNFDNFLATDLATADPANLAASVTDDDVTLTWDASF